MSGTPEMDVGDVRPHLVESHRRLSSLVDGADAVDLGAPSACAQWTVARVIAHLGAGAEIAAATLRRGLEGESEPLPLAEMRSVWEIYDELADDVAVDRSMAADRSLLDDLGALSGDDLTSTTVPFLLGPTPASVFAVFRLAEHAIHTWDVEVVSDVDAELAPPVAAILLDTVVNAMIGRLAQPLEDPPIDVLGVNLSDSGRRLEVGLADPVTLNDSDRQLDAQVELSTPAFVRLAYGRLTPERTPPGTRLVGPIAWRQLRALFPGF